MARWNVTKHDHEGLHFAAAARSASTEGQVPLGVLKSGQCDINR